MKAMFFDMDGTLIDSRADLSTAVNVTRQQLGLSVLPQETVVGFVGNGAKFLLSHAIPERAADVDALWPQYFENYLKHALDETVLYPGVKETLERLAANGWKLGIVTNKPGEVTRRILDHFEIRHLFGEAVIGGGDCDELKPSAKPLFAAAARLDHVVTPADWMVGDNWTDLDCAANAGINSAFCAFGFGTLKNSHFTKRITQFGEISALVG